MTDLQLEQTVEVEVVDTPVDFPPADLRLFRLSVQKYHSMIESGILTEEHNLELLEGWLVEKIGTTPTHSVINEIIGDLLRAILPDGYVVTIQQPITTADSESEPDVAVITGKRRDYLTQHPLADQVQIVVEVANTSIKQDRNIKQRIYARAGIPTYWLVNLEARKLEVYTLPGGSGATARYAHGIELDEAAAVEVVIAGQVVGAIPVGEMLP
jgi:Uma2 family endonuclease